MDSALHVIYHHSAGSWMKSRLAELRANAGLNVTVVPPTDHNRFSQSLSTVHAIWHVLEPLTSEHFEAAPRLRLVQKIGVGVNTIDVRAANNRGIAVCNMPGTNSQAVAEMTVALILASLRRLPYLHTQTIAGKGWALDPDVGETSGELGSLTVGLVGYGSIPQRLMPLLAGFGARVIYTATAPKKEAAAEWRPLDALLRESDVVSLHVPLTASTTSMIGARELQRMKPGAVLVNTSRGGVVDHEALVAALRSGQLGFAGLDVHQNEPLEIDDPILELENVIVTPHVSWQTRNTFERSIEVAVENCRRLQAGEPLLHQVNPNNAGPGP